jgi:signal transduction histidine kinase
MPSGGRLSVATRNAEAGDPALAMAGLAGRFVEVAVVDQGEGMPPEVAEHAFEPFFTTKPVGTGSGLGLSQVYGFARQSRGAVLIDSAPGRGTAIRFYLPKWEPAATAEAVPDFPAGIAVVPAT